MARKFRLTCARTTYFDVEVTADNSAEAERLLDAALACDPARPEIHPIGQPINRIVEIAPQEEAAPVRRQPETRWAGAVGDKPAGSRQYLAH